jgi:hypothetical protein
MYVCVSTCEHTQQVTADRIQYKYYIVMTMSYISALKNASILFLSLCKNSAFCHSCYSSAQVYQPQHIRSCNMSQLAEITVYQFAHRRLKAQKFLSSFTGDQKQSLVTSNT